LLISQQEACRAWTGQVRVKSAERCTRLVQAMPPRVRGA